jgi:hypothetical protein
LQIAIRNELGKLPFQCTFDLAAPLAQFRFDERQTKGAVDIFLVSGNDAAAFVQPVRLEAHAVLLGEYAKALQVGGRSCRVYRYGAEMPAVGDVDLQPAGLHEGRVLSRRSLGHNSVIADEFAAAPEIASDGQALEFGPRRGAIPPRAPEGPQRGACEAGLGRSSRWQGSGGSWSAALRRAPSGPELTGNLRQSVSPSMRRPLALRHSLRNMRRARFVSQQNKAGRKAGLLSQCI